MTARWYGCEPGREQLLDSPDATTWHAEVQRDPRRGYVWRTASGVEGQAPTARRAKLAARRARRAEQERGAA